MKLYGVQRNVQVPCNCFVGEASHYCSQHLKFARAWTLGEVVTALLGAGLRLEQVTEHPVDWWAGHRDVRPEERGRVPLSFSIVATRGD